MDLFLISVGETDLYKLIMPRGVRRNFPQQPEQREVSELTSTSPELDVNNLLNWTVAQLRKKLTKLGINVPKGFSAATLRINSTQMQLGKPRLIFIANTKNIGVSSNGVGHVNLVSAEIRKNILKGEDINLCSVLIPAYETPRKDLEKADKRLNRNLNISKFVTAFSRLKRITHGDSKSWTCIWPT